MDTITRTGTPLRQRMMEDMRMRKLEPRTQESYIRAVRKLTIYLKRSPDKATVEDLRNFQLHLVDAGTSRGGASIVNLSSVAGRHGGGPGAIAYSTAKGAMLTLTRGLASEYAPKGVRVNAVTPGLILGSAFHTQHTPEETQRKIIAGIPLGRPGTTEDVARAVAYLASEFDGFITGATLDINGGVYLM